jgi:hypothetical protein
MRAAAVLCCALLAACAGRPDALVPGTWRGDFTPADGIPVGALFHLSRSGSTLGLELESQYVRQRFTDVRLHGDTLAFTWPGQRTRVCTLLPASAGFLAGSCEGEGLQPIRLLLLPPGSDDVPTGLARAALDSGIAWAEERDGTVRVLIEEGSLLELRETLRASAASAFRDAFALLGAAPPRVPFWFFYVDSRSTMARLVHWPAGGRADGVARTAAHTVTPAGRSPDRHEIMHVAAVAAWGIPADPWQWINEGLATWAQGECAGYGIHTLAAALAARDEAAPLRRLVYEFREVDEVAAYLQGGSFTGWVLQHFGADALRTMWQHGFDALPAALGMSAEEAERSWRQFLTHIDHGTADLTVVRQRGCS